MKARRFGFSLFTGGGGGEGVEGGNGGGGRGDGGGGKKTFGCLRSTSARAREGGGSSNPRCSEMKGREETKKNAIESCYGGE